MAAPDKFSEDRMVTKMLAGGSCELKGKQGRKDEENGGTKLKVETMTWKSQVSEQE